MTNKPFYLYQRLVQFIQEETIKNPELTWRRFHGVFTKEQFMAETGFTLDEVNNQIYEIENWSDYHGIPSITAFMRPLPSTLKEMVYADVHTYIRSKTNLMVQRCFLKLEIDELGCVNVVGKEDSGFKGAVKILVASGDVPSASSNILERDLAAACYGRLTKDLIGGGYGGKVDW